MFISSYLTSSWFDSHQIQCQVSFKYKLVEYKVLWKSVRWFLSYSNFQEQETYYCRMKIGVLQNDNRKWSRLQLLTFGGGLIFIDLMSAEDTRKLHPLVTSCDRQDFKVESRPNCKRLALNLRRWTFPIKQQLHRVSSYPKINQFSFGVSVCFQFSFSSVSSVSVQFLQFQFSFSSVSVQFQFQFSFNSVSNQFQSPV